MDYRYIEAFLEVATHKNFSQAALNLKIAVSAVSRQIKLFEESVGLTLFIRNTRNVELTEEGLGVFEICKRLTDDVKSFTSVSKQSIRVGFLQSALEWCIGRGLADIFKSSHLNAFVHVGSPENLENELLHSKLDLALTLKPLDLPNVKTTLIAEEKFVWVQSRSRAQTNVQIVWEPIKNQCTTPPFQPEKVLYINSLNGAIALVESGLGFSLLPAWAKEQKKFHQIHTASLNSKIYLLERVQVAWSAEQIKFISMLKGMKKLLNA